MSHHHWTSSTSIQSRSMSINRRSINIHRRCSATNFRGAGEVRRSGGEGRDTGCVVAMRTPACQRGDEGESVYESATMVECAENGEGSKSENYEGSKSENGEGKRERERRAMVKRGEDPALVQEVHTTSFIYGLVPNSAENAEDLRNTSKRREHRSARNVEARNVEARNVEVRNVEARNVEVRNVEARNVEARNVEAQLWSLLY